MTITTPPDNGCDDCAWLTEVTEERAYCEECARDIAEVKDAAELAFYAMRNPKTEKYSEEYFRAEDAWTAACVELKELEG